MSPQDPLRRPPRVSVAVFDPSVAPVTLVIDGFHGAHWNYVVRTLSSLSRHLIPVTVCGRHGAMELDADEMMERLSSAGVDATGIRVPQAAAAQPDVIARCPLLAPEHGLYPWSERALMCPAETAWVPLRLSLTSFDSDFRALGEELDRLVDLAESIHDAASWPTVKMQADAWLNRRVAIELTDIGQYAIGRSVAEVHRCVGWISARVQARSMYWSNRRRPVPAIRDADPARSMRPSAARDQWRARWTAAVAATAVRHRNLLAFSPWSILSLEQCERFELLSLLIHADAVCLAAPDCMPPLSKRGEQAFQRALFVALQQRQALDQIAKLV